MENEIKHRPIGTIIQELLQHPDLVRLDWVTKQYVEEQFEDYCDIKEIEGNFDEFWKSKSEEMNENSALMFTFNEYFLCSFFDEYFEMSN